MRKQRRKDTAPEIAIRRILHSQGYRYRVDFLLPDTRRRADLVFTRCKVAIFVDGCFWHSCPMHGTVPKTNTKWWVEKLARNVERDRDTDRLLKEAGWIVLRFWEHESPQAAAEEVAAVLTRFY
ncbi:very short patch repair endonuclease [Salinicola endophyticus]|uniref:Very short patch repair endonuclease n=1 Tax=Salinicola endophyticus TaxID=1949083 RepID=A0AB74UHT4_9GAMM